MHMAERRRRRRGRGRTRHRAASLDVRPAHVPRPQDRLGLDKVGDAAVVVDAAHVEPRPAALPPEPAHEAQHGGLAAERDVVHADVALDREDHEGLLVEHVAHVGRERRPEREERRDEVRVPQEPRVVVERSGGVAVSSWPVVVVVAVAAAARRCRPRELVEARLEPSRQVERVGPARVVKARVAEDAADPLARVLEGRGLRALGGVLAARVSRGRGVEVVERARREAEEVDAEDAVDGLGARAGEGAVVGRAEGGGVRDDGQKCVCVRGGGASAIESGAGHCGGREDAPLPTERTPRHPLTRLWRRVATSRSTSSLGKSSTTTETLPSSCEAGDEVAGGERKTRAHSLEVRTSERPLEARMSHSWSGTCIAPCTTSWSRVEGGRRRSTASDPRRPLTLSLHSRYGSNHPPDDPRRVQ